MPCPAGSSRRPTRHGAGARQELRGVRRAQVGRGELANVRNVGVERCEDRLHGRHPPAVDVTAVAVGVGAGGGGLRIGIWPPGAAARPAGAANRQHGCARPTAPARWRGGGVRSSAAPTGKADAAPTTAPTTVQTTRRGGRLMALRSGPRGDRRGSPLPRLATPRARLSRFEVHIPSLRRSIGQRSALSFAVDQARNLVHGHRRSTWAGTNSHSSPTVGGRFSSLGAKRGTRSRRCQNQTRAPSIDGCRGAHPDALQPHRGTGRDAGTHGEYGAGVSTRRLPEREARAEP